MSLTTGARLGQYEITGLLGAGGMGEVFRARDTRLGREVAIKVLPAEVEHNPERLSRFEREARVLASLNHPNIAQVYGFENTTLDDGSRVHYIAMEMVEGEDLSQRLKRGRMPVDESIAIAKQIAEGLEEAHEHGIVHRDLKPANVKVTPDGKTKVLDFGIAKTLTTDAAKASAAGGSGDRTATIQGTEAGRILGTVAYMSPEQARGKAVDRRTDVWSFGALLFEMLSGKLLFPGETVSDILAAVLTREPDWTTLPASTPPSVVRLLHRCLDRDLRNRLQSIGEARVALERAGKEETPAASVKASARQVLLNRAFGFAAGALAVASLFLLLRGRTASDGPRRGPVHATVNLPPDTTLALGRGSAVSISPDGQRLVFAGRNQGKVLLYLRPLDRLAAETLPGTENATDPFFSPDGQWVGFFADSKLKKVALDGGAPVIIGEALNPRGEAWGEGDQIFLTPTSGSAVVSVSAMSRSEPRPITTLMTGQLSHRWPRPVPGGLGLLYTIWNDNGWEPSQIAFQPMAGGPPKLLVPSGGGYPHFLKDRETGRGYLVFARATGLLAARFDESRLEVMGQPVPTLEGLLTNLSGGAHFDVSSSGTLAYVPGSSNEASRELTWVSLTGKEEPPLKPRNAGEQWSLSPDGKQLARQASDQLSREIWIENLANGGSARLTSAGDDSAPVFSRDGQWVAFSRGAVASLFRQRIDGAGGEQALTRNTPRGQFAWDFSPDGRSLLYQQFEEGSVDLWVLTLPRSDAAPGSLAPDAHPFVNTKFNEGFATFSPDGRHVAYQSNETGRFEIYVRPFPEGSPKFQVSVNGGFSPRWMPGGGEILYRSPDGAMLATAVQAAPVFEAGKTRRLFDASRYANKFEVSSDGTKLLMMPRLSAERSAVQINLVVDFLAELRRRIR